MTLPLPTLDLAEQVGRLRHETRRSVEECRRARAALAATVAKSRELQAGCQAEREAKRADDEKE